METCQEYLQAQRNGKKLHSIRLLRSDFAGRIHNNPQGKRVCDRFRSKHAHGQQERVIRAELETVRISKSPTTVVTANGEVLTKEEATVHVRELDLFVTVMLLEDTPAVLSLGKLCEDRGYSCEWTNGPKPNLIKNGKKIHRDTSNHVVPLPRPLLLHPHRRIL